MILRKLGTFAFDLFLAALCLWCAGAIWFDLPFRGGPWLAGGFLMGALALRLLVRRHPRLVVFFLCLLIVAGWRLLLRADNHRDWQGDVRETAWAEINGDTVTIHNVRNFAYRTPTDYTPNWETRTVNLSKLTGSDLFINYWGSPWMVHPLASFEFSDAPPICFSIETRREVGEDYSAIGGFYRRYELIYIVSDERDAVRVRTNLRNEDLYIYRMTLTPEEARVRFLEYIAALNKLHDKPRWYNAITTNCTTAIRSQRPAASRTPWDWRILINGKGDEWLYETKAIVTDDLPFADLKHQALINSAAKSANDDPDFSRRIREGRVGFSKTP